MIRSVVLALDAFLATGVSPYDSMKLRGEEHTRAVQAGLYLLIDAADTVVHMEAHDDTGTVPLDVVRSEIARCLAAYRSGQPFGSDLLRAFIDGKEPPKTAG